MHCLRPILAGIVALHPLGVRAESGGTVEVRLACRESAAKTSAAGAVDSRASIELLDRRHKVLSKIGELGCGQVVLIQTRDLLRGAAIRPVRVGFWGDLQNLEPDTEILNLALEPAGKVRVLVPARQPAGPTPVVALRFQRGG